LPNRIAHIAWWWEWWDNCSGKGKRDGRRQGQSWTIRFVRIVSLVGSDGISPPFVSSDEPMIYKKHLVSPIKH